MSLFLLFAAAACSAAASILLRLAAQMNVEIISAGALSLSTLMNASTALRIGAIASYGVGFLMYAIALKRIDLSAAYPMMVGMTILVLLIYGVFAGEAITLKGLAGAAMVVFGVALIYV
jgi:small multidrug resistance pump